MEKEYQLGPYLKSQIGGEFQTFEELPGSEKFVLANFRADLPSLERLELLVDRRYSENSFSPQEAIVSAVLAEQIPLKDRENRYLQWYFRDDVSLQVELRREPSGKSVSGNVVLVSDISAGLY